jgi:hypothetical protein
MKGKRQIAREAQKRKQARQRYMILGGVGLVVVAIIVVIVLLNSNSSTAAAGTGGGLMGTAVPDQSRAHVPSDQEPGPYVTNPPSGGAHYDTDWEAHFYQESELANLPKYPQGYLVHSLEHGYVIFWYNCQAPNIDCTQLKQSIQKVMTETGGTKLIAFPWTTMDVPLAMTSWGQVLKFPKVDEALMKQFVLRNRYQAPEPDAP